MPRCGSCGKMASYEELEPEIDSDPEVDEDGHVSIGDVRIVNASECCGEELTEAHFEMEGDVEDDFAPAHDSRVDHSDLEAAISKVFRDAFEAHPERETDKAKALAEARKVAEAELPTGDDAVAGSFQDDLLTWEATKHELSAEVVGQERINPPDPKAKPGTPSRYRKTFYGARVEIEVSCICGESTTVTLEDSVQASGMDSLS
jgi:hypothetical protein